MHTLPPVLAPVTALYAAALALMFCALSVRVAMLRMRLKASLGDAGDLRLQRAIRAHGNLTEYAPMALLLLLLMELNGANALLLHAGGGLLLLSRAMHAYGVSQVNERLGWRAAGLAGTINVLSGAAVWLLWAGLTAWVGR